MGLPDSYTLKPAAIAGYFDAIREAQPPDRFSIRFLEGLGFKSTNDRLLIRVLKDLGFLDSDGQPTATYFKYLDKEHSERVLGAAIKIAFSDLFAVRNTANLLSSEEVKDKLRTLYAGKKSDTTIARVASTFAALCEIANFDGVGATDDVPSKPEPAVVPPPSPAPPDPSAGPRFTKRADVALGSLQYHINIVLPDSRDQAVFDAIFKSLTEHLGGGNG